MLSRTIGNASVLAFKTAQRQSQLRLFNASAVAFKEKTMVDQAKESAQNLVNKAKETYESAKDKVEAQEVTNKINETFENVKDSVANAAKAVGGQNLAEKASHAVEQAKEMAQKVRGTIEGPNITESVKEAYEQAKEKAHDLKNTVIGGDGPGSGTTPSATGKSSTYDPRGSQEHVAKLIKENKKEFAEFDKKHGGDGRSDGGFDPKSV